ncbi:MAG: hypothetical protein FWC34_11505 [Bacteroidetes bacterium]|nr:hypothetical protein [Bacteroidota bacterium]MCL2302198.1 hypothetical protein [Lentimicrobiaceae bacterium]MCL2302278.1 hypothetical protein [Lentimicrobiaceae bacterium]
MLKFINRKIAFQWMLLLGLLTLSVYVVITQAQLSNEQGTVFLYKNFAHFFSQYEFFGKGIIIAVLLLQVVLLQYYFTKNEFTAKNSLLPACFYLSILLLTKSLITISPSFFTLLFLLITISINYATSSAKLKINAFWIGILIALGTCFDLSSFILLILVMATLIINQFFKIKEIGILLFGVALVYFYFFSYFFFTNSYCDWILEFQQIKILGILDGEILTRTSILISLIVLGVIYMYFIIRTRLINESKVVTQRKKVVTFNTCAILMLACLFISNSAYPYILGYLSVPISIYLAILAQEKNPLFINEIITILTLFLLWL